MCPSISCIHFASYVDFPHWPLHHFLCFSCFNTGTSPASTTSCMHLASVSKFPPPCARSKKTCTSPKKKVPRPKNIQPNVSAYNKQWSFPSPLWRQGPRSRCTGPKNKNRAQKQLIWLLKKNPWVQHKYMQVQKKIPTGSRKHTSKSPTFFVTLGPKKFWLGPKSMYRSKKKGAQVQKTCIPISRGLTTVGLECHALV